MKIKILVLLVIILIIGLFSYYRKDKTTIQIEKLIPQEGQEENQSSSNSGVLLTNLEIPWELAFLPTSRGEPDGRMLLTERPGSLLLISGENKNFEIKEVAHIGEGGLLGMALDPDFVRNKFVYLYFTYREGGNILNKIQRFVFEDENLNADKVVIEGIPGSNNHDGGRIKFGPDGKLYVATGDAQDQNSAQDVNSLAGKILRINSDGSYPSDNPFPNSPVYSYGHRNPQGLAWDNNGNLWATEHGPSGIWPNCCQDEVNLVEKGKNYGWPDSRGDKVNVGTTGPVIHSGRDIWAPSGGVVKDGKFYFAALAGRAVFGFDLKTRELRKYLEEEYGRIRSVNLDSDGNFYLITSNRDGRNSNPDVSDDRLIKISPELLK